MMTEGLLSGRRWALGVGQAGNRDPLTEHPGQDGKIDWGTFRDRQRLAWMPRVPKEVRGTPQHLRGNLEFLWGGGSALLIYGLIARALTGSDAPIKAIVLGLIGLAIGVGVAIRLYLTVRRRPRA